MGKTSTNPLRQRLLHEYQKLRGIARMLWAQLKIPNELNQRFVRFSQIRAKDFLALQRVFWFDTDCEIVF